MVNTEKKGPFRPLKARSERRTREADELAESNPVYVLKKEVRLRDPNAKITITKPRLHPFARVKARAEWDISSRDDYITSSTGNVITEIISGKRVDIAFLKKRREGYHGFMVNSGNGEDLIPIHADPGEVTDTITAAVDNPQPFERTYIPLREALLKRSSRAI